MRAVKGVRTMSARMGVVCFVLLWGALRTAPAPAEEAPPGALAATLLRWAGLKNGFCVQLGLSDGRLAAELARGGKLLVHALSTDKRAVSSARRYLRSRGLYGQVSVEKVGSLEDLPYAENLANLVLVKSLPDASREGLSLRELMRVVCPNGVALLGADGASRTKAAFRARLTRTGLRDFRIIEKDGLWARIVKPRPEEMDEWTHLRHDAGGGSVSRDGIFGPLGGLRWVAGPAWPMVYHKNGFAKVLSAGGCNIYFTINDASNMGRTVPERERWWFLVARDAYNGLFLWSRPITSGTYEGNAHKGLKRLIHGQVVDNTVLGGGRLFTVLDGELVAIDARSGKIIRKYGKDRVPQAGLRFHKNLLFVAGRYGRPLTAIDPESGRTRWQCAEGGVPVIGDDRVFFLSGKELVKLEAGTGKEVWRKAIGSWARGRVQIRFYKSGILVFGWEADKKSGLQVVSAEDGEHLWDYPKEPASPSFRRNYFFHADGLLWVMYPSKEKARHVVWEGFQSRTGATKRRHTLNFGRIGNCGALPAATEDFFIDGRPPRVMEWKSGRLQVYDGVRGSCGAHYTLANGLCYSQPIDCACVPGALRGFLATEPKKDSAARPRHPGPAGADSRLETGAAYGKVAVQRPARAEPRSEWRTFRHDAGRSGSAAPVPARLELLWQASVIETPSTPDPTLLADWRANNVTGGDPLTQPVIAGGLVLVSLTDAHQVVALDCATGKRRWSHAAGGRLDAPPTMYKGLCLFGSRDGYASCLRAADGELVWRFRAAPEDRRIVAFGQLESKWPVTGGVMVDNDLAYFMAGRASAADGGIYAYAVNPASGAVVWTSRSIVGEGRRGFLNNFLVGGGATVRVGPSCEVWRLDAKTGKSIVAGYRGGKSGLGGMFDRSWRWLDTYSGFFAQRRGRFSGMLVAFDRKYCYYATKLLLRQKAYPAKIFAAESSYARDRKTLWSFDVPEPLQVEALLLAGDVLFAAGPLDRRDSKKGGFLWAISSADGRKLQEYKLNSPPVVEGLAAAGGRIFLAARDGRLLCFGKE